ncbi:hypothetical protein OG592_02720 [Streptomyces avidinii]|uniref:hypothetical protein n=1 Tax=Streptomyces avidinii TaxID=1895 RepID=UPI00386DE127|nr:hypothetical protein OG592_02720 [Streptomyces avidinii]
MPSTTHWSAYDGRAGRPRAEALRAVCACGWRGAAEYPLDWETIGDRPLYEADVDLAGPLADWTAHLSVVRDTAVPLPALLAEMAGQLTATATAEPLSALRAAGVLERIAARVSWETAGTLRDDGMSAEAVATALGITPHPPLPCETHIGRCASHCRRPVPERDHATPFTPRPEGRTQRTHACPVASSPSPPP